MYALHSNNTTEVNGVAEPHPNPVHRKGAKGRKETNTAGLKTHCYRDDTLAAVKLNCGKNHWLIGSLIWPHLD